MQKMKKDNITFKKLQETDVVLLHQWFQIPHVLKWYAREKAYTFKEIQEKYLPRIKDATVPSYIVYDEDKPVGYIQFYQVEYHFPEGIKNNHHPLFDEFNPAELAGIDLFIADENHLRMGYSSNVLKAFINKYMKNNFKAVLVDPDKNNITAIKFFEKNGFKHILSQDEQHHLMIKNIGEDMEYTISYDPAPKPDDTKIIWQGVSEHAKKVRGLPSGKPFAFFIKDSLNQIKGGCSGYIYYGCLYVDLLWVDESLRGKQYGTQLMKNAEKLAHANHCNFIATNTMDFEALDFYKKLGFEIEFEKKGFEKHSSMYFLRKNLK
jgi:GNAT superfamily N-acetyltransferase